MNRMSDAVGNNVVTYVLDQDLEDLLRAVFDVKATQRHEVLEALEYDHMTTWKWFMRLDDEDIDELSKHARNNVRAPIAKKYRRELMSFQRMIAERKENKVPGAKDISSYNARDIDDYYEKHCSEISLVMKTMFETKNIAKDEEQAMTEYQISNLNLNSLQRTCRNREDNDDEDGKTFGIATTRFINDRRLSKLRRPKISGIETTRLARTLPCESNESHTHDQERNFDNLKTLESAKPHKD